MNAAHVSDSAPWLNSDVSHKSATAPKHRTIQIHSATADDSHEVRRLCAGAAPPGWLPSAYATAPAPTEVSLSARRLM